MKLNAPKIVTLLLSLVLGVVAVLNFFGVVSVFPEYNFYILLGAYVLLLLGVILKALLKTKGRKPRPFLLRFRNGELNRGRLKYLIVV